MGAEKIATTKIENIEERNAGIKEIPVYRNPPLHDDLEKPVTEQ